MKRTLLWVLAAFLCAAMLSACDGNWKGLDKSTYFVNFGDEVIYEIEGADKSEFVVTVEDEAILAVEGKSIRAIKAGISTFTVSDGEITLTATVKVNPKPLAAPRLSFADGILSWDVIEHADGYIIELDGEVVSLQLSNEFDTDKLPGGFKVFRVAAISHDNNYATSDFTKLDITLEQPALIGIVVDKLPTITTYCAGDVVSLDGIKVVAKFNRGGDKDISDEVVCDKGSVIAGDSKLTVSYCGFNSEISIVVKPSLSFVTNGGSSIPVQYHLTGAAVETPSPVLIGSTFVGWYTDSDFINEFGDVMPAQNTTLYARWFGGDATVVSQGQSIQAAIDDASTGGTIFVKAGTFAEYLQISKPVVLLGNNFGVSASEVRRPETYLYPASAENFNVYGSSPIIDISVSGVTVAGFSIDGNNPVIANVWTQERNTAMQSVVSDTKSGVLVKAFYNSLVDKDTGVDCTVGIRVYRRAVTDDSITDIVIRNNIIKNFSHTALWLDNNNHAKAELSNAGSIVEGNYISNVRMFGLIYFDGSYIGGYGLAMVVDAYAADIVRNTFEANAGGIQFTWMYYAGQTTAINDNKFINNSFGIWVNSTGFGDGLVIKGNTFVKNSAYESLEGMISYVNYGILLSGTEKGTLIIGNNNIDNFEYGIFVNNTREDSVTISDNIISNCGAAIALGTEFLSYTNYKSATYITAVGNLFGGNGKNFAMDDKTEAVCYKIVHLAPSGSVANIEAIGKLATPAVSFVAASNSVRWKEIANAAGYELFINGELVADSFDEAVNGYIIYALDLTGEAAPQYLVQVVAKGMYSISSSDSNTLTLVRVTIEETLLDVNTTNQSKTYYCLPGTLVSTFKAISNHERLSILSSVDGYQNQVETDAAIDQSATFSIVWIKLYKITFNDGTVAVGSIMARYGSTVGDYSAPEIEGMEVEGWYTAKTFKVAYDEETVVTKALTIYVKYTAESAQ